MDVGIEYSSAPLEASRDGSIWSPAVDYQKSSHSEVRLMFGDGRASPNDGALTTLSRGPGSCGKRAI